MFDSVQGCNALIDSLVQATGSYQDAMFLYLTILMSENVNMGVFRDEDEYSYQKLRNQPKYFNIIGVLEPKDTKTIEVYIINSTKEFHQGAASQGVSSEMKSHNYLFKSTFKKSEKGEWFIFEKKPRTDVDPREKTIWKKY